MVDVSGVPAGVNPDAHFKNLSGPTFEDFYLASGTCLLLQSLIVAYVGPGPYETALNEFTAGGGIALAGPVCFLQQRGDLLAPSRATSR